MNGLYWDASDRFPPIFSNPWDSDTRMDRPLPSGTPSGGSHTRIYRSIQCGGRDKFQGGYLMVREMHLSKSVQRTIRDAGWELEDLDFGGMGRGKHWYFQVEYFCGDNTAGVFYRGVGIGVHMGYRRPYPQGRRWVPWNRPCGGYLESYQCHHLPAPGRLHQVPCCSVQVQIMERNWDGHLGGQNPLTDYGHAAGANLWDFCGSPQDLWRNGPGARPGDNGRVWGGPPGLPDPDPVLGFSNHGRKGERILWVPLSGVPGCHQGVPTFSPGYSMPW